MSEAAAQPLEKQKKRSRTSNAAKKRYNSRTYSKYTFLVPKSGGLDLYIQAYREQGGSTGELVRQALIEYIASHKARQKAGGGQAL